MHRHDYRGLIWYVVQDTSSGRHHRFSSTAYQVVGMMDGNRSVQQIWEAVNVRLGDYAPTQDETIKLLGQLHAADLLQSDVTPDTEELFQRQEKQKHDQFKQRFGNPLTQKVPLWDPEDFLQKYLPRVRWLFHWTIGLVWILVVMLAALFAVIHWDELSYDLTTRSLLPYNLVLLGFIYPIIKLLHEFGHAFAAKLEGGEVHEMGIMFMVLMPIPYADVSSASAFRSKRKRMLVGAMGIMVELFIASLAVFLWISIEPGLVRNIALNIILIGGISSLFFNGNPLLRYDGYYIFADAIGIPNLYRRSTQYLGYLFQRYLFKVKDLSSPAMTPGEPGWFIVYSISSFIYRIGILALIILFVSEKFFVLGVLLALWLISSQIALPLFKCITFVATSPRIRRQRLRAISVSLSLCVGVFISLWVIPIPSSTSAEGVIWMPEDAQLRAETDGFISRLFSKPSSDVKAGTSIIQVDDPFLHARVKILESKLKQLNTRYAAHWLRDRVQAEILKEEIGKVTAEWKHAREREQSMIIRSPKNGKLLIPMHKDQLGRFVSQGELIGYIIDDSKPTARIVIAQDDIGQVRKRTLGVEARLASRLDQSLPAKVLREVPQAGNRLPSAALASTHGGSFVIDPNGQDGLTTLEKFFQYDIELSLPIEQAPIGTRVYVRFDHGSEPIAYQWYRRIRQLFLRQFSV